MSLCSDKGLQTDYVTIVTYCADKLFWHSFWRLRIGFWTLTNKKNSVLLLNVFSCVLSWMENWSFQIFHKFIPLQWNPWSHVTWVVSFINIIYGVIEPNRIVVKDTNKERYFLVYQNFKRILKWNTSNYFAISGGILSESIHIN